AKLSGSIVPPCEAWPVRFAPMSGQAAIDARAPGVPTAGRTTWPWRIRSEAGYQTPVGDVVHDRNVGEPGPHFDATHTRHVGDVPTGRGRGDVRQGDGTIR